MEITELQKEEEKAWDKYVYKSDSSTFYHQIGWRNVVEKTYKHKPIYLIAKEEGEIKGILPLFLMRSVIFGKKLVSVSFAPYGGVCANYVTFILEFIFRNTNSEMALNKNVQNDAPVA